MIESRFWSSEYLRCVTPVITNEYKQNTTGINMIIKCTCEHKQQDKLHGDKNRVYNKRAGAKDKREEYRCTVCKTIKHGN